MRTRPVVRTLALATTAALIAGAFSAPAHAGKKLKCAAFKPVEPASDAGEKAEAVEAPVVKLSPKHTEEKPFVAEYSHGPAYWDTLTQTPIHEDTVYFNFQVFSKAPTSGLHVRLEWPAPSPSDIDLYLFDSAGERVASSGAFNPVPAPGLNAGGNGGQGFESIPGFAAGSCSGFTVESRAFITPGEDMTLKAWLGEVGEEIPE